MAVEICGLPSIRAGDMLLPTARAVAPVAAAATATTLRDIIIDAAVCTRIRKNLIVQLMTVQEARQHCRWRMGVWLQARTAQTTTRLEQELHKVK